MDVDAGAYSNQLGVYFDTNFVKFTYIFGTEFSFRYDFCLILLFFRYEFREISVYLH